jgi:NOL1/NOP2/fmu family ribosome biogenesis protein
MWKHRKSFFKGSLGKVALPNIFIFQVIFPILSPIGDLVFIISLFRGDMMAIMAGYILFLFMDLVGSLIAFALEKAARLWPHRVRGEGHFVAKLIKKGAKIITDAGTNLGADSTKELAEYSDNRKSFSSHAALAEETIPYDKLPESFRSFVMDNLNEIPEGVYSLKGHNLYCLPEPPPRLDGLRVAKFGWFLGTFESNRFEPSHSMVTALDMQAFKRSINLGYNDREISSYLKGETLMLEGEKGLTAVCVDGWTLGWAKQTGEMLKNMYPKGWRRMN